ncbi:ROK family protein [Naasia sp. SYSU D00948]|uniref:ROK family protein n=1 Tax=Naasia sp. SYSU D00948 TaxID=2817379 RepID=UPI001B3065DC|nr:ROK family protein [Naasia sp. SYSU D00948]
MLTGSSPQVLRALNARRVLDHAWDVDAFTASDAMAWTGLTRSTVIGVCDHLVRQGWLDEVDDARAVGDYRKGRPARRYALSDRAAVVVGLDAGYDHMTATVADLRGTPLARSTVGIPARTPESIDRLADAEARRAFARRTIEQAIASSGVDPRQVLAITVGVPAPVDDAGRSPGHHWFWELVNPGFGSTLAGLAPIVQIENDANLLAIAEGAVEEGRGRGVHSYVAMVVGEGIGSGLMIDGRLIRGRRGGAGEMRFLDRVEGVGSPDGLALLCRAWAIEAIRSGTLPEGSLLGRLDPDTLRESDVEEAADAGDAAAIAILDRLGDRLAVICLVVGDLLDVDLVIVGGAIADALPAVIRRARATLADSDDPTAPELVASRLGPEAVGTGAIHYALGLVRERALDLAPGARHVA